MPMYLFKHGLTNKSDRSKKTAMEPGQFQPGQFRPSWKARGDGKLVCPFSLNGTAEKPAILIYIYIHMVDTCL